MKEMAIENVIVDVLDMKEAQQDRLETVLAESELILNRVNERLERITQRQVELENKVKQLDGLLYFIEWQLDKDAKWFFLLTYWKNLEFALFKISKVVS